MTKSYKDYTQEEKDAYKQKRSAWLQRKEETFDNAYNQLMEELTALKSTKGIELLKQLKKPSGSSDGKTTYMSAIFDTEEPVVGTIRTFKQIAMRGPNGQRMSDNETAKEFITRMDGEVDYKYDSASINQMVWYINRRHPNAITLDKEGCTVTFNGF